MNYNKEDFIFNQKKENKAEGYTDYYFTIPKSLKAEIISKNAEMDMVGMDNLIYCFPEDELIGQFVYVFNISYNKINGFEEIKNILKEIIEEMEE